MHSITVHANTSLIRRLSIILFLFCATFFLIACESNHTLPNSQVPPLPSQVVTLPNVGVSDISYFDPASGPDANSALVISMVYSGLVKSDKDLNVVPDQATWKVSDDKKMYTFTLKNGVTFSDGTPVNAHTYIYTWTRALQPDVSSPDAAFLESSIVGANEVSRGKTKTLTGLKAIDEHTLQVTLKQATPYFLQALTSSLFFPLNQKIIDKYGQKDWVQHAEGSGVGTGPFMVKTWNHNVKMTLIPNPHYYDDKTKIVEVDMPFAKEASTAFKSYRAGQYSLIWNIAPDDQEAAKGQAGFVRVPELQTDLLFFDTTRPPFNNVSVRQAFALAIDKVTLAHTFFKDAVVPAPTILPPGMPGYQANFAGLAYDKDKAKALFQSVYPDVTVFPPITFSYPNALMSQDEAHVLQQMWLNTLGVQVKMVEVEQSTYDSQLTDNRTTHQIQFGFMQWTADFPDPYDSLTLYLTSNAANNSGSWSNTTFDQTVSQADTASSEDERFALFDKAEQIVINDAGWLPLDHQTLAAIIPSWLHGATVNANGLFFDDWSNVYVTRH